MPEKLPNENASGPHPENTAKQYEPEAKKINNEPKRSAMVKNLNKSTSTTGHNQITQADIGTKNCP